MVYKKINTYLFRISLLSGWAFAILLFVWFVFIDSDPLAPREIPESFDFPYYIAFSAGVGVLIQACLKLLRGIYGWRLFKLVISFVAIMIFAYVGFAYRNATFAIKRSTGAYQLNLITARLFSSAEENNGFLPDADQWYDLLLQRNEDLSTEYLRFPDIPIDDPNEYHVAMNENLSGLHLSQVHPETVLLFIAKGSWNLNGEKELLQTNEDVLLPVVLKNREVWYIRKEEIKDLRWEP